MLILDMAIDASGGYDAPVKPAKRLEDLPIEEIRKALRKMENEGVILSDGVKKSKTYRLA